MTEKTPVVTDKAPKALPGIYSQAIKANGFVFVSGAHQCIKNLTAILEAAGSDILKVVKVNVFLSNMDDFAAMNEVYSQYWGDVKPCRTCVAVKTLPLNVDVEIECTATY
ncbi:hypothetical protein GQX73_g672 [Xylaria multiplex]|uniref:Uncharacterized protein n=1 Tax=Xylaria multiplex TaxID=323545 RepID=A0A7C8J3M7_9PEZI|nr:hypothetical protein GQX73_g672 [Xylaria multiplex]